MQIAYGSDYKKENKIENERYARLIIRGLYFQENKSPPHVRYIFKGLFAELRKI